MYCKKHLPHPISLLALTMVFLLGCQDSQPFDVKAGPRIVIEDLNGSMSAEDTFQVTQVLESMVSFYQAPLNLKYPVTVRVKLFESDDQYRRYRSRNSRSDSKNGYYSKTYNEAVVNKNKRYRKTLFHEAQHSVLRSRLKRPPLWVNEGLAELYERAYLHNGQLHVKQSNKKRRRLVKWLNDGTLNLEEFLSMSKKQLEARTIKVERYSRTIAWGLIYFLMSSDDRRQTLTNILAQLRKKSGQSSVVLIEQFYRGGLSAFDRDFRAFMRRIPDSYLL